MNGRSNYSVEETVSLSDFAGNQFTMYRLNPVGYAIYDHNNNFIEGSYQCNSPYDAYDDGTFYYVGPTCYYVQDENGILDIKEGITYSLSQMKGGTYALRPNIELEQMRSSVSTNAYPSPVSGKSTTYNDFTVINDYNFFRKMSKIPQYGTNTCALVAISILLSYCDTFYNDAFVPENYVEKSYKEYDGSNPSVSDIDIDDFKKSPNMMNGFVKLLLEEYASSIIFTDGAMANAEIRSTINKYIEAEASSLVGNYSTDDGAVFFTHANTRDFIADGLPVLISMTKYTPASETKASKTKYHTVVAYGYDSNDRFLVHMGYRDEQEMILSSATIYSYYALTYTGSHVHSCNYKAAKSNGTNWGSVELGYVCGCGAVLDSNKNVISD